MFGKQECRDMYIYIEDRRLPSESMYVPVYICVFKFFSETTGPMNIAITRGNYFNGNYISCMEEFCRDRLTPALNYCGYI